MVPPLTTSKVYNRGLVTSQPQTSQYIERSEPLARGPTRADEGAVEGQRITAADPGSMGTGRSSWGTGQDDKDADGPGPEKSKHNSSSQSQEPDGRQHEDA